MNRRQKLVQKQFLNNEKAVIDRLQYVYDQALFEINEKIRNLEFTIGDLTEAYDWADGDEKDVIKSKIQAKIYQKQYQEQLQKQVDGILKQMQSREFLTISDYLDTCYEDGFVGSLFDMHGQGVPMLMPIDQESMVRAIQLDSKISEGLYTKLGEDVGVLKKRITSTVTRSIATGVSYEQAAQLLAGQTKIGYNKSVRIARTEGHRIQCSAAMDVMVNAKDMGADVVKQWDATLDGHTRPSHRLVDGEIREVDEPFSNGLDFPGDLDGGAAEVVNCRCALLQRARWALKEKIDPDTGEVTWEDGQFTKMNNFTKELETFDSPQNYKEFKEGFFSDGNVKYMNYVQQMQDKYGTRDIKKILSKMTTREYNHYSKLVANNPVFNAKAPVKPTFTPAKSIEEAEEFAKQFASRVNYAGVTNLDAVNELNRALQTLNDECPVDKLSYIATNGRLKNTEAQACFDCLEINPNWLNNGWANQESWAERVARNLEKIEEYRKYTDPKKYPRDTVKYYKKYIKQWEEECKYTRWTTTLNDVFGTITHEYGHILADQYFGQINGHRANSNWLSNPALADQKFFVGETFRKAKKNGDIYSISMYAAKNEHEFFAETFTMYMTGEPLPEYIEDMVKKVISDGKL